MIDLNDLKKKAMAATPGEWVIDTDEADNACESTKWVGVGNDEQFHAMCGDHDDPQSIADAEFIAAASPATVLELVERLERAERRLETSERLAHQLIASKNLWAERAEKAESELAKAEFRNEEAIRHANRRAEANKEIATDRLSDAELDQLGLMRKSSEPVAVVTAVRLNPNIIDGWKPHRIDIEWLHNKPLECGQYLYIGGVKRIREPACPSSRHDADLPTIEGEQNKRLYAAAVADEAVASICETAAAQGCIVHSDGRIHKATDAELDAMIAQVEAAGGSKLPELQLTGGNQAGKATLLQRIKAAVTRRRDGGGV